MKISYRILLINFAIVVLILSSSAFAFYSVMYEVLTSQKSQYLLTSANNLVYTLREIQQEWIDDFLSLNEQTRKGKSSDKNTRFSPQDIDFVFKEEDDGKLVSVLTNIYLIKAPAEQFTLEEFVKENPLTLITSRADDSGIKYYFGKIISEEFLNLISRRINSEVAVISGGVPEEISNKLNNRQYLKVLLDAGKALKNKDNYKTYTSSGNPTDLIAAVYRANELSIPGNSDLRFLIFNSISEVAGLDSSIQSILLIIGSAGVILSLILTFVFTDKLRKEIRIVSAATKISNDGKFISKINLKSRDELGQLSSSFNEMIDELEKHQKARNDYSEFLTLLNQNPSFSEISDAALKKIIKSCGFTAGALYSVYNNEVALTSSFGVKSGVSVKENNDLFYTVAKNKEAIEFNFSTEMPVVSSGTYDISIKYLLIQPVIYNGNVIAILELAGTESPITEAKEYLSNIHDQLAIGLTNAGAFVQLENLVSELRLLNEQYQKQNMHIRKQNDTLTELHEKLKEKAEELEIQKEKAEESAKLKSQFLAAVSHELRTPMNSILGLTELIVNDQSIEPKNRERLKVVLKNGNRLMNLINEILDLSKIEAGKLEINPDDSAVEDIISSAESAVSHLAAQKKLKLIIERDTDTNVIVNSDREKITQVLINLLDNAVKFTESGSVTLRISLQENLLKFKVADTGIGIAGDDLEVIFNEFRQLDGSNSRKYNGAGLGLAICKKIADILKGYISVESELGKGSVFTFAVPVTISKLTNTYVYSAQKDNGETKKSIIIIDNDADIRYTIGQYLVSRNYEVLFAENQIQALEKVKTHKPFAAALEMNLHGVDSWNLLAEIKKNPDTSAMPVILFSINNELNFGHGLSTFDYLVNPIDAENLISVLSEFELTAKRKIEKILVLGDAQFDLPELTGMNKSLKIEVMNNADHFYNKIHQFHPDLIIADILMPELDGISLMQQLKSGRDTRNIPVVLTIPSNFSVQQTERLNETMDKLTLNTKAHPLDLLKIIRDRIEIHESYREKTVTDSSEYFMTEDSAIPLDPDNDYMGEVLIVDDDADTLFTLDEIIKTCNCKTILAKSGKECIQILEHSTPGLILLDIMMPEMDGFQTLQNIRRKKKTKNIPVFAVTARAMAEDKEVILRYGFDDYISKPVNSGVIAFKIEKIFSKIKIAL